MSTDTFQARTTTHAAPHARVFQFSLARILVAITAAAVFFAILAPLTGEGNSRWYWLGMLVLVVLFVDTSFFYVQLGNHALASGRTSRALWWYDRAVRADPHNADYFYLRGCAHQHLDDAASALADFKAATQLNAKRSYAWLGCAAAQFSLRDFQGAIDSSLMALLQEPLNAEALVLRAFACHVLGRFEEALADVDHLLDAQPDLADVICIRGRILRDAGRLDEALQAFRLGEELGGGQTVPVDRAFTLIRMGRYEEARALLQAHLSRHPDDADALVVLAYLLAACPDDALRNGQQALQLCREAQALGTLDSWSLAANFAAAHAEAEQFDEAVRYGEEALAGAWPYRREEYQARLEAYRGGKPWRERVRI